jgi:uracil-DNA glycosylase
MDREKEMQKIKREVESLNSADLYQFRIHNNYTPVIGEGSLFAEIMLIGEAPGKKEAETGKPFCGRSGKVLDLLLEAIKIQRQDVYITSVLKDRPPHNRDPRKDEVALYAPILMKQIAVIKPKVIGTLGRFSTECVFSHFNILNKLKTTSEMHGKFFKVSSSYGEIVIVPLYHPAVALYRASMLPELKKDFKRIKKLVSVQSL